MVLNKKDLDELQKALVAKKQEIENELAKFTTKDESGNYTTDFPEDLGTERSETANEVEEYTDRLGVEKSLETQLTDIDDALKRMDDGVYGNDEVTGESIPLDRLHAYPAARTNIEKH